MSELLTELETVTACDEALASLGDNPMMESIKVLINGRKEVLAKAEAQERIKADFAKALEAMELPTPPDGITNIYRTFGKLYRPLSKAERKEVAASLPNLTEVDLDARKVENGIGWKVWEINKAVTVVHGSGTGQASTSPRRAITVYKIEEGKLMVVGNFHNGAEACKHLNLRFEGNSAPRVLRDHDYLIKAYDGTEYTLPA